MVAVPICVTLSVSNNLISCVVPASALTNVPDPVPSMVIKSESYETTVPVAIPTPPPSYNLTTLSATGGVVNPTTLILAFALPPIPVVPAIPVTAWLAK